VGWPVGIEGWLVGCVVGSVLGKEVGCLEG